MKYAARQGFQSRRWRDDLIEPDQIYKEYHQTPLKEKYEKLCAKYYSAEQRRIGLSKQAAYKRKLNGTFKKFLRFLARRDRNLLIYIFGEGGEGKSRLAVAVYHMMAMALKEFHPDWKLVLKYTESQDDTQQKISEIENGDTILQDEDPDVLGIGSKNMAKKMGTLLKELRKTQKNVIFCSPSMHVYANVFVALEVSGLNEDAFYTRALVWYFDRQALEIKAYPLGFIEVDVGKIEAEFNEYVKNFKDPHLKNIQSTKGGVTASSNVKKWEQLAPAFASCALEHGWNGNSKKALVETYIGYFVDECREKGHPIAPDMNDTKQLAEITYNYQQNRVEKEKQLQQDEKEEEMENMENKFEVNEIDLVNEMKGEPYQDWKSKMKDIDIFLLNRDQGKSYSTIAKKLGYKSTSRIGEAIRAVINRLDHKYGKNFEFYCKKLVDELDQYDPATRDGAPGKADVWAVNDTEKTAIVVCCKCPSYELDTHSVPVEEQVPEIEKAKELQSAGYAVTCVCKLHNRASGHLWEQKINFENPGCLTFKY